MSHVDSQILRGQREDEGGAHKDYLTLYYRTGWDSCLLHGCPRGQTVWCDIELQDAREFPGWKVIALDEDAVEFVLCDAGKTSWDNPPHWAHAKNYSIDSRGDYALRDGHLRGLSAVDRFLMALNLVAVELGGSNISETGEHLTNQCFYLALARSLLGREDGKVLRDTALALKRQVEEAVLQVHPDWVGAGQMGEDVPAASDFVAYPMRRADSLFASLAVAVVDTVTCVAEIYRGIAYEGCAPLLLLYTPGHFQACCVDGEIQDAPKLSLLRLRQLFTECGVAFVETCG